MGLLNLFFSKTREVGLTRLPSGSFTVDREGKLLTSTLPQSFPDTYRQEITRCVLATLQAARKAQMPLSEIIIQYAALKLLARELRGGAMVFLMPQAFQHHRVRAPKPTAVSP